MLAALLLAAQAPAPAPTPQTLPPGNWERVAWEGPIMAYYDPGSVHPVEDRLSVRILLVGEFGGGARMATMIVELHCANHSGIPLEADIFDGRGNLIRQRRTPPAARRAVPTEPGSSDEAVQRRVCGAAPPPPDA